MSNEKIIELILENNKDSEESENDSVKSLLETINKNKNSKSSLQRKESKRRFSISENKSILVNCYNLTNEQLIVEGIEIFKNPHRTFEENQIVIEFLKNLNPFAFLIKQVKKENARDLFSSLSFTLKYKFLEKNSIIYKYNDLQDNFYIILNGKVDLLVPNEEIIKLSEAEYYIYLLKLYKHKENELLERTINRNHMTFQIKELNFENWLKRAIITLLNQKMKHHKRKERNSSILKTQMYGKTTFSDFMTETRRNNKRNTFTIKNSLTFQPKKNTFNNKYFLGAKPFKTNEEIDLVMIIQDEIMKVYKYLEKKTFLGILNEKVSPQDYIKRIKPIFLNNKHLQFNTERREVVIYNYFIAETLSQGEQFGEPNYSHNLNNNNNEENNLRVETVIASKDIDLAFLSKSVFNDVLKETHEKSRKDKINFLNQLKIFKTESKYGNINNFSHYFKRKVCQYKEIIYLENAPYENNHLIYFVKQGEFETNANKSLKDIDEILLNTNYKSKINKVEIDALSNLKEYQNKRQLKFETFGVNDIIGLSNCIYNDKYLFTISNKTSNSIVYQINVNFFKMLLNLSPITKERFIQLQKKKNDIISNLLFQQRLSIINYIYVLYKDDPEFNFYLSHGISRIRKEIYSEKKMINEEYKPSTYKLNNKKNNKKNIRLSGCLGNSKLISRPQSTKSRYLLNTFTTPINLMKKKSNFDYDLLMNNDDTGKSTNYRNLNTLSSNSNNLYFEFASNNLKFSSFRTTNKYIKEIKKKVTKKDKVIKLKLMNDNNSNTITNNSFIFVNPLAYDDFNRNYNSFRYFMPSKEDLKENLYRLEIYSSLPKKNNKVNKSKGRPKSAAIYKKKKLLLNI